MAIFRNVQMSFWTDTKVSEDFTPEERYMYIYLLTNPYTNLCGCYSIGLKQIAHDTGLDVKKVKTVIQRLQVDHNVIRYSEDNREMLLPNWSKYNWTDSEKFRKPLLNQINTVKTPEFREYLIWLYNGNDTVSIPYKYGNDTTVTDTVDNTVDDSVGVIQTIKPDLMPTVKAVIDHLNEKARTHYRMNNRQTVDKIKARLNDGFTADDLCKVIDNKVNDWMGTDMQKFIRPETLFGAKCESYLNEQPKARSGTKFQNFPAREDPEHKDMVAKIIAMNTGG